MDEPQERTWKDQLPRCFGDADQKFAFHALDEQRARTMIEEARESGASDEHILAAIHDHLVSKGATQDHIEEQMTFAKEFIENA